MPELYATPNSRCIQCCDCCGMFSPQNVCVATHIKRLENRTCHWGFDSANWRSYLLLAKDQEFADQLQRYLDELKLRFDVMSRFKRKEVSAVWMWAFVTVVYDKMLWKRHDMLAYFAYGHEFEGRRLLTICPRVLCGCSPVQVTVKYETVCNINNILQSGLWV